MIAINAASTNNPVYCFVRSITESADTVPSAYTNKENTTTVRVTMKHSNHVIYIMVTYHILYRDSIPQWRSTIVIYRLLNRRKPNLNLQYITVYLICPTLDR